MKAKSVRGRNVTRVNGQTETISATVPTVLVRDVRDRVGAREFSKFVTHAIERELIRLNREKFVADVVKETGRLDAKKIEEWRKILER